MKYTPFTLNFSVSRISMKHLLFICLIQYPTTASSILTIYIYSDIKRDHNAICDEKGEPVEKNRVLLESNPELFEYFAMPNGIYTFSSEASTSVNFRGYNSFRVFLMRLRAIRGHFSRDGKRFSDAQEKLKVTHNSQSFNSATALSMAMEFGGTLPNIPPGASNLMSHVPFDDLIGFPDSGGVLGSEVCRQLQKDFEDYKELAYVSGARPEIIDLFNFFLKELTNFNTYGDTVIKFI